jgi:uncharacterized membrane protein
VWKKKNQWLLPWLSNEKPSVTLTSSTKCGANNSIFSIHIHTYISQTVVGTSALWAGSWSTLGTQLIESRPSLSSIGAISFHLACLSLGGLTLPVEFNNPGQSWCIGVMSLQVHNYCIVSTCKAKILWRCPAVHRQRRQK